MRLNIGKRGAWLPGALSACVWLLAALSAPALAQDAPAPSPARESPIEAAADSEADASIQARLERIYAQIDGLQNIAVGVAEGVVTLDGAIQDQADSEQAEAIAHRVQGVVAVQNNTAPSVDVGERVSPLFQRLTVTAASAVGAAPLFVLAFVVFAVIAGLAWWVASLERFWRRLAHNPFIGELLAQAVRAAGFVIGVVVALNLLGATALMGAILGGAGVIGLAIGFAVRDSLENYISSIMLSLRQPFRANDHVVIDGHEGKVVRLTSRATILMSLDGNHLRIPNATVFKAIILNYTRNPERRLSFELGVDAADDPLAAIEVGVSALRTLDFVLETPPPAGIIQTIGDSNIVLQFTGWIDQRNADFLKGRSQAIRATKMAVEAGGFTLPEPIYRLRIDQLPADARLDVQSGARSAEQASARRPQAANAAASVTPDRHLDEAIADERRATAEDDLLNARRPVE